MGLIKGDTRSLDSSSYVVMIAAMANQNGSCAVGPARPSAAKLR